MEGEEEKSANGEGPRQPQKQNHVDGREDISMWRIMFGSCGSGVGDIVHLFSKCNTDTSAAPNSNQPNVVLFPYGGGEHRKTRGASRARCMPSQQQPLKRSCEVMEIPELVGSDLGHMSSMNGDGESATGEGAFHAFDDDISALSANTLEAMVATNHISLNLTRSEQAILNRRVRSNKSSSSSPRSGLRTESPLEGVTTTSGFPCASPTPTADSRYMYVKNYSPCYLEKTQRIRTHETIKVSASLSSAAPDEVQVGPRPEKEAPGAWI